MSGRALRFLYSALLYLIAPLALARLWWRGRRLPAYRGRWRERFAFFTPPPRAAGVWVHAVSVGEFAAALPLIRRLLDRGEYVIVTTTTPTGSERVRATLGERVFHVYAPYDLPDVVSRFLGRVRPRLLVVMETELWPNLFHSCRARGIPLVIVNARLSARSAQGYVRVAKLTRATLANVSEVLAQGEADAQRLIGLGACAAHVCVTGNIKYDMTVPDDLRDRAAALRASWGAARPVWIAASTHEGEERMVLAAHARIRERRPDALLVLVPRHPDRFSDVHRLCVATGFRVVRRSADNGNAGAAVFLGDTLGELVLFYAAADVAFVGGSLVPTGGHNVLEPAALGLPLLVGPHNFNFADITPRLLQAAGATEVRDGEELAREVMRLFADPGQRAIMGNRAHEVVLANRGALDRVFERLEHYLAKPGS